MRFSKAETWEALDAALEDVERGLAAEFQVAPDPSAVRRLQAMVAEGPDRFNLDAVWTWADARGERLAEVWFSLRPMVLEQLDRIDAFLVRHAGN